MRIMEIECPNCGSSISIMNTENKREIKCPYCDSTFLMDDANTFIINKNVNINQTNRNIDEAKILKIKAQREEKRREDLGTILVVVSLVLFFIVFGISNNINTKKDNARREKAISEGKLIPGSSSDYYEINYKSAIKKLKTIGFTNITHIDLHEGIVFYNDGEVEDISIDGNTHFDKYDGFDPDAKIIITHK